MHHGNGTRRTIRCGWLASAQQEGGTKAAAEGAFRIGVRIWSWEAMGRDR